MSSSPSHRPNVRSIAGILCAVLMLGSCNRHRNDQSPDDANWARYGKTDAEERFSPLTDINAATVSRLGVAWYHQFDTDRGQEATPIVVDGKMYVSTAWSKVYAFDATDGRMLWQFDPQVPPQTLFKSCCDAVNRGVAVSGGRVFISTLDGRLIAIDAATGRQSWSVQTVDATKAYTSTGAPHIIKGKVMIGNSGAEYGVRGYISAYDESTGHMAWRFYTVPNPDEKLVAPDSRA